MPNHRGWGSYINYGYIGCAQAGNHGWARMKKIHNYNFDVGRQAAYNQCVSVEIRSFIDIRVHP